MSGVIFGTEDTKMNELSEKECGFWSHVIMGMDSSSPVYWMCYLGQVINLSGTMFLHLQDNNNNNSFFIRLLCGFNIICKAFTGMGNYNSSFQVHY